MQIEKDPKIENVVKHQVGFGTAFKATLGVLVAQAVVGIIFFALFVAVVISAIMLLM